MSTRPAVKQRPHGYGVEEFKEEKASAESTSTESDSPLLAEFLQSKKASKFFADRERKREKFAETYGASIAATESILAWAVLALHAEEFNPLDIIHRLLIAIGMPQTEHQLQMNNKFPWNYTFLGKYIKQFCKWHLESCQNAAALKQGWPNHIVFALYVNDFFAYKLGPVIEVRADLVKNRFEMDRIGNKDVKMSSVIPDVAAITRKYDHLFNEVSEGKPRSTIRSIEKACNYLHDVVKLSNAARRDLAARQATLVKDLVDNDTIARTSLLFLAPPKQSKRSKHQRSTAENDKDDDKDDASKASKQRGAVQAIGDTTEHTGASTADSPSPQSGQHEDERGHTTRTICSVEDLISSSDEDEDADQSGGQTAKDGKSHNVAAEFELILASGQHTIEEPNNVSP